MSKSSVQLATLFPGQGSQSPGMAKVLLENFSWTRQIFEEASDAIKVDVLKLCLEGSSDELQLTQNQQPCILTTSSAWYQVAKRNLSLLPAAAGGHSLGEYSALVAGGALSLTDAVKLVRVRGELMQNAVPKGKGKMAAVLGLGDAKVIELCQLASEGADSLVVAANFNAPNQVVIAGHTEAVDRATALAQGLEHPQLKARKVMPLNVSAPFHSPLMKPVAEKFVAHLKSVSWKALQFPVVSNLDAQLRDRGDLIPILRDQIDHAVKWTDCAKTLHSKGCRVFLEVGPGKVLSGLMKRILDEPKLFSLETVDGLKALEEYFTKESR